MNCIHEPDCTPDSTLKKKGTKAPSVTLDEVAKNVFLYIGGSPHLKKTEKQIENKYSFKKECDGCWSEDNIKRAWGKTQRMDETSLKRKRWTLAIMLQVIKRSSGFDEFKGNASDQILAEEDIVRSKGPASKSPLPSSNEKDHNRGGSNKLNSQTVYIRIPLSVMFRNESPSRRGGGSKEKDSTTYKLIDRFPFLPEIKKKKSYVTLYNNQTRNATWVYEILNKSTLAVAPSFNKNKGNDNRCEDDIDYSLYQAAESTKTCDESDYERGHLAAASNHTWCTKAYEDTFVLSNMVPQLSHLNQGKWKKLEDYCKGKSKENGVRNVHVYSGPLYKVHDDIKKREIQKIWRTKVVPTHFFKVVIVENEDGTVEMECYEMPNAIEDEIKQSKDKKNNQKTKTNNQKTKKKQSKKTNEQSEDKNEQSEDENEQSKDKNEQSEDENEQSKDKNEQSEDKIEQSKNKKNNQKTKTNNQKTTKKQSKDKNEQSEDKNEQSEDKNEQKSKKLKKELEKYKVSIKQIEIDSGLRFTESSCTEGEIDSTRTVKWEGKDGNEGLCSAKIKVRISIPPADHNDFVYI